MNIVVKDYFLVSAEALNLVLRVVIVIRSCSFIYKQILFFVRFFSFSFFFHFTLEFLFRPFSPFKLAHAYFQFEVFLYVLYLYFPSAGFCS